MPNRFSPPSRATASNSEPPPSVFGRNHPALAPALTFPFPTSRKELRPPAAPLPRTPAERNGRRRRSPETRWRRRVAQAGRTIEAVCPVATSSARVDGSDGSDCRRGLLRSGRSRRSARPRHGSSRNAPLEDSIPHCPVEHPVCSAVRSSSPDCPDESRLGIPHFHLDHLLLIMINVAFCVHVTFQDFDNLGHSRPVFAVDLQTPHCKIHHVNHLLLVCLHVITILVNQIC
ncbi:hypothetical protein EJB05_56062, partial [Eragrostis curvula]